MGATDAATVPDYYARNKLECDFWYKLMDIRRLVSDDTLAVIAELGGSGIRSITTGRSLSTAGWWTCR